MPTEDSLLRAMFDVRPVDRSGHVDLQKIGNVEEVVDLKTTQISSNQAVAAIVDEAFGTIFDRVINVGISDPRTELANLGGFVDFESSVWRSGLNRKQRGSIRNFSGRYIKAVTVSDETNYNDLLSQIRELPGKKEAGEPPKRAQAQSDNNDRREYSSGEIDILLRDFKNPQQKESVFKPQDEPIQVESYYQPSPEEPKKKGLWKKFFLVLVTASAVTGFSVYATSYGFSIKNSATEDGTSALKSLEEAGENLKVFDFEGASDSFREAYEYFTQAGESLNIAGETMSGLISELPGADKLKSAKNLVEAGKLMAVSGQAMSDAVAALSKTGAVLNANTNSGLGAFNDLISALSLSKINLEKSATLLNEVDVSVIPEDKQAQFFKFKGQLPTMTGSVEDALAYARFFEGFLGSDKPRRYLLLFQNNSELRPTGGFPGTYGIISFEGGRLKDFKVDDVYNLDTSQPRDFIPPKQLQHITPTWGMRDANWFIDFPTSAQKVMWFYKQATGEDVDGVVTLTPSMVAEILGLVGPVAMPEYGTTLNGDNFVAELQAEIEYGPNRQQPKEIVKDLAPKLLEKIYLSSGDTWLGIFNIILAGLDRKDMLMYFTDLRLKDFAIERGFSGRVEDPSIRTGQVSDYLMVALANVKGSKTDLYTVTEYELSTEISDDGYAYHDLTIVRTHNGGNEEYGFYNRENPAYVRVLVPEGAELVSIEGNEHVNHRPLISYDRKFVTDEQLFQLEQDADYDADDAVYTIQESGKAGFAFWLVVAPGETSTVHLSYKVPFDDAGDYQLYIQKQPGLTAGLDVQLKSDLPVLGASPQFNKIGDTFNFEGQLLHDTVLGLGFE